MKDALFGPPAWRDADGFGLGFLGTWTLEEKAEVSLKPPNGTTMTAPESLTFYRHPDPITHLQTESRINALLATLPDDLIGIITAVQNSLLHIFWAERYGVTLSEARKAEVEIRSAADMLRNIHAIDATPLTEPRRPEQRLVGNCRDFAVLTVALLRRAGIQHCVPPSEFSRYCTNS